VTDGQPMLAPPFYVGKATDDCRLVGRWCTMDIFIGWLSAHFLEVAILVLLWTMTHSVLRIEDSLKQAERYLLALVDKEHIDIADGAKRPWRRSHDG
jgi:hypothetical protein